ncbi:MAG TPA: cupin domain-containing protein [Chitinophagaceae bacterium]|jgi:mannose-6-phosphate isomerase-like protein (cupin superfamily)|nr:cupin domain-containing protein [Chitinophagaceae bacterium]
MNNIQQPRRRFLFTAIAGFCTALVAGLPKISFGKAPSGNEKGFVVHEAEGEHIITGRRKAPMNIKFSKQTHGIDNISFCTEDIVPGGKIRVHKHLNEDEFIFFHKGEGKFTLDDKDFEIKAGTIVFVPKGVWHGLENNGEENIYMVFGYSPFGFEGYFRENGTPAGIPAKERTAEEYAETERKYGIVFK